MLLTTQLQGLAAYFRHSTLFYYFTTDLKRNFTYVNPLFHHTFEDLAEDFYTIPAEDIFIDSDRIKFHTLVDQCLDSPGIRPGVELQVKSFSGSPHRIRWEISVINGPDNRPNHIQAVGIAADDDPLLIEIAKHSKHQANILKNVTDTIVTTDLDRKVTSWNKVTEKLTGIREQDAIGKVTHEILDTSYFPYTHEQVAEITNRDGSWRGEMSFTGCDGEKKYLLHTVSLLKNDKGEKIGLLGVGKDITARKEAEEKLLESELFYRNMIAHSMDGIVMTDAQARIVYSAPSVEIVTGHKPEQLLGHDIFEFVHPDDVEKAQEAFWKEFNNQAELSYIQIRLRHMDGHWVWCTARGHNLLDNPAVNAYVVYFADDTMRKETEDKLVSSEKHFRDLFYNLNHAVIMLDRHGVVTASNYAAQTILGIEEKEMIGMKGTEGGRDIVNEKGELIPEEKYPVAIAIKEKQSVKNVVIGDIHDITKERIWILVNADPNFDEDGELLYVIVSFTDITEQKRLSQQLIEQEIQKQKQLTQATIDGQEKERMEIGKELHDNISQHLTTTRLYLEVAKEHASGSTLEMVQLSHKMLSSIINEIRSISQSLIPPTLGDIGLVESVQDLCDSLKRAHAFDIEFYYRHFEEEGLPDNMKLMLFRIIQEQVNNIIRHAQAENIYIRMISDAESITLTITDNGKGFDPGLYKKGLGLKNIYNRVSLFNGKMDIEAGPGKGCNLIVCIPLPDGPGND